MKKYMSTSKWIVFNNKGERLRTVTLKHKDNEIYKEIDLFEAKLKEQGLYAHDAECFEQDYLKGKSFIEKLKYLGWEFDDKGIII
jgi:hypothetical protein